MPFPAFFLLAAALGTRESLRGRRTQQRMLDFEAERQDEINNIDVGLQSMGVSNVFDARKLQALQKQEQTGQGLLRSKDPRMQAQGALMLQKVSAAVLSGIQQNENEFRADEARREDQEVLAAGLGKADNEKRFERSAVMNKQLNEKIQPFLDAQLSFNKVMNLLNNDDQLASLAGLTAFVQSIDNSVVREGELLKYKGANGLITQLVNIVNKSEGRDFDPATKQSLRNASAAIFNAEKTRAVAITNSFQNRALAQSLNEKIVMSGVDQTLFTPVIIDRAAQEAAQSDADAAEQDFTADPTQFEEDTGEAFGFDIPGTEKRVTFNPGDNITNRLVRPFLEMTAAVGRTLRGAKLLRKNDGTLWIQEADGSMSPVTNRDFTDLQKRLKDGGVKLPPDLQRRVDAGELEARQL